MKHNGGVPSTEEPLTMSLARKAVRIGTETIGELDLLRQDQACGDIVFWHSRGKGGEGCVRFQSKRRKAHRGSRKPWNSEPTETAHYVTWKGMNRARRNGFVVVAFYDLSEEYLRGTLFKRGSPAHTVVHEHCAEISHKVDYEENGPFL